MFVRVETKSKQKNELHTWPETWHKVAGFKGEYLGSTFKGHSMKCVTCDARLIFVISQRSMP